jgi:hypothetical protein
MGAVYYLAVEFHRKGFSGSKIGKAPAKIVVLIIAATRAVLVFDPALAVKLMHVV